VIRKKNSREKRKEIRWRVQLQSLIFLIRCGKNLVIYDDPTPLSSFQYPFSIQSLILTLFDSVLGPKKIIRISLANLGYILHATEFSALTLDIQMGIS
jgi:integral membrane sensor domain MASE1